MPISCDAAGHGKVGKTVSSSFRCLAVYTILAMYYAGSREQLRAGGSFNILIKSGVKVE